MAPLFSTSALVPDKWSASRPCRFTPGTHWIGGWVGARMGLADVERRTALQRMELKPSSPSLYRLLTARSVLLLFSIILMCTELREGQVPIRHFSRHENTVMQ
jgi:hypothetical protein